MTRFYCPFFQCTPIPLPPSHRINVNGYDRYFLIAKKRGVDPVQLEKELKGMLDRIVMKCLAKNPHERFDSVEQLAKEIKKKIGKKDDHEANSVINVIGWTKGKSWFPWSLSLGAIIIGLISFWIIVQPGRTKINAPDAPHAEAAKLMLRMLGELKSPTKDISDIERCQTPNGKLIWQWLLAQEWFSKKPIPRIIGYGGDDAHPIVDIVFEYPTGTEHGNETMSVKFMRENGIVKLDDVNLMEMKGARFDGMPLSLIVTNRTEANRQFAALNPQMKGLDFVQFAKQ